MNQIKRWTVSVFSRIDALVAKVENHEALATEALRELQRATARANVQLKRVQRDGERQRRELSEAREAAQQWRERARRTIDDEARAMECLRRAKQAATRVSEVEARLEEHQQVEQQLQLDIRGLEERLSRLTDQRNLLRTRQSRADALGVVNGDKVQLESEVDELFDRWEMRITESEYAGGLNGAFESGADAFETEFADEDEARELRAELEALRGESDA